MPLRIRPVGEDVPATRKNVYVGKGNEKGKETIPVEEPRKEVVYDHRSVVPFKPDVLFSELGYKGMVTRFNRASAQLVSETDVSHLDSVPPLDRVRQLQASATQVFIFVWFI